MNTNTNIMNKIDALWNTPEAMLVGHGEDFDKPIDRDQAVDDDGKAIFKYYTLSICIAADYPDSHYIVINFSAEDMEAYARTWKKQA